MDLFNGFVVDGRRRSRFPPSRLGLYTVAWENIAEGAYDT
jgi:hypothetical protein